MGVYENGLADCNGCDGKHKRRVDALVCPDCERRAHNDAMTGFAEMQPFMRKHLAFTDFLIQTRFRGETNTHN